MEILNARHLTKRFGKLVAINDVSFNIRNGEVVGIIGPNGAGKTTLLNMLTGYLRFDEGRVFFSEKEISMSKPEDIVKLGFLRTFQQPRFIAELTAMENLMVVPMSQRGESWLWSLRKGSWKEYESILEKRCGGVLEQLGLKREAQKKSRDLSFGQIKLLNLGMCLISDASLVALDEPVAGMAPHMRQVTARIITEKPKNRSYVIIEHHMDFLRQIADRVLFISQGKLLLEGSPDEVLGSSVALEAFLGPEDGNV
jgi:branched-chain amino acid transport system ATP-binding protein